MEVKEGRLAGQVAIVTGACGGIGQATCLCLVREGAHLVAVDIDPAGVESTLEAVRARCSQNLGSEAMLGLALDVRSEEDMEKMARLAVDRFGHINILVASAGILRVRGAPPRMLAEMCEAEWDAVLDTNLKGVFLSNRAVLPTMIRQKTGQIVNISSVSGRQGRAYDSAYCASKFGVIGLTEALAEEVRQYNIRVQIVLPGAVDTPLWEQNGPIPRPPSLLPPERVAECIVYLITLPEDAMLLSPIIAPFQGRRKKSHA